MKPLNNYHPYSVERTHVTASEGSVSGVTTVKAAHISELRAAIDAMRTLAGLPQAGWSTGVSQGLTIFGVLVEQLQTKLAEAPQSLSLTVPGFTDATLSGLHTHGERPKSGQAGNCDILIFGQLT